MISNPFSWWNCTIIKNCKWEYKTKCVWLICSLNKYLLNSCNMSALFWVLGMGWTTQMKFSYLVGKWGWELYIEIDHQTQRVRWYELSRRMIEQGKRERAEVRSDCFIWGGSQRMLFHWDEFSTKIKKERSRMRECLWWGRPGSVDCETGRDRRLPWLKLGGLG